MWILTTLLAIFVISYFYLKQIQKKNPLNAFFEPPGHPIFGHGFIISSASQVISVAAGYFKKYGKILKFRLGVSICPIREGLVTSDYKFIEFILTNNKILSKSENYFYLKPWLRNGLLISDGDYWRRHRKILTPTFHFEILKEFVEVFERIGGVFVKKLEHCTDLSSVDLHPLTTLCTLDVICETAMGTKMNIQNGENPQYVKSVKDMCRIAIERMFFPLKIFWWSFWLTSDFYKQRRALNILHSFTKDVIDAKKDKQIQIKTKKMAFLDLLLKYSQGENALNDDELREEVDTFMFEGHDTTSAGICFILYCLADHPEVQDKVLQEQKDLFGENKDPEITYSDLQNMKYLEHVIKESLRLYPPVPALGRYTTEEVKFGEYTIPKNTNIVMFVYSLHRDPEYFSEPEKFIPERFETVDGTLPYAYIPFSAGPRNCIGQKFAMLEMKSIVSKIVRHFEIKPTVPRHELKLSVEAVMKSTNGIRVSLKKRV